MFWIEIRCHLIPRVLIGEVNMVRNCHVGTSDTHILPIRKKFSIRIPSKSMLSKLLALGNSCIPTTETIRRYQHLNISSMIGQLFCMN